jgi:hypothetical protein
VQVAAVAEQVAQLFKEVMEVEVLVEIMLEKRNL